MKRKLIWRSFLALVATTVGPLSGMLAQGAEFNGLLADDAAAVAPPTVPEKGPPLPFHSIEGVGGGAITPMAYLVNPGPEGTIWGKPAVAMSYVNLNHKNLDALTITETIFGRIELGYAADRLGLGTLPGDIQAVTGTDIDRGDVWLHNFNIRTLLVKENTCFGGWALPAITAGVHFKYNNGIDDINRRLNGTLSNALGYERNNGTEFTLTFTKTIPPEVLGRPLILSAGLRESQAANLVFLGFTDTYLDSFECNVAYLPFDNFLVAYEFRQ
ncbi:MAG: DUF3034 family protein, partial [Thermoguttaceae bacterium]